MSISARNIESLGLPELARVLVSQRRLDESATTLQLLLMLMFGNLERVLQCPKIVSHAWELDVIVGRADLVLFHEDAAVTIIEAKGETRSPVDIAAGIGQLLLYAVSLPSRLGYEPTSVNLVLAYPHKKDAGHNAIANACLRAGVAPLRLAPNSYMHDMVDQSWPKT